MQKINKQAVALLLCGCLAGGATAYGAYAYFSGKTETVHNTYKLAKGSKGELGTIKVVETEWDKVTEHLFAPNQTLKKNPVMHSDMGYDSYCIVRVQIPIIEAKAVIDTENSNLFGTEVNDGTTLAKMAGVKLKYRDNLCFNTNDFTDITGKDIKELVDNAQVGDKISLYFAYNDILSAGDSTSEIFDSIQAPDYTEISNISNYTVDIDAYAIQSIGYTKDEAIQTLMSEITE